MSTHELLQRLDRVEAGVVSLIAERDALQSRLEKVEAVCTTAEDEMREANAEVEAEASRPSRMRAHVFCDDLRAALAPTTKETS